MRPREPQGRLNEENCQELTETDRKDRNGAERTVLTVLRPRSTAQQGGSNLSKLSKLTETDGKGRRKVTKLTEKGGKGRREEEENHVPAGLNLTFLLKLSVIVSSVSFVNNGSFSQFCQKQA